MRRCSRKRNFVAANNEPIVNHGEAVVVLQQESGAEVLNTFQVADVSRPLHSISKICDEGFEVRFTKTHATIITPQGREICRFERKGGLYVAQLHLKNPDFEHFARRGQDA